MSRFVHCLLLTLVFSLIVWGCGEQSSEPTAGTVPLRIDVKFADGPEGLLRHGELATTGGGPYVIERITGQAFSYDKQTNRTTLQDTDTDEITPDQTRFALELIVPPGSNYTVTIRAHGREPATGETGILYTGSAFLKTVSIDGENRAEVILEIQAPRLSVLIVEDTYRISWTPVTDAVRYQLFELDTPSGQLRQYDVLQTDTTLTFPPTFEGAVRQYKVKGQFDDDSTTVASNQIDVQLPPLIAPAPITDLHITSFAQTEATLSWTATGDDGSEGTASEYDLRQSVNPITVGNFEDATRLSDISVPNPAGSIEVYVAQNLLPDTDYYYALRAIDDAGNRSPLSNVAFFTTLPTSDDVTPPNPVLLAESELTPASVRLNWTAPGDDGDEGTAARYELRRSLSPISERDFPNGDLIATPVPAIAGTAQSTVATGLSPATLYYFALRAYDEAENASALTDVLEVLTPETSSPPSAIADLGATATSENEIVLTWTAPTPGTSPLAEYDLRASTLPITMDNFPDADREDTVSPGAPGAAEALIITDLGRKSTIYFAIITIDVAGGRSALSNVAFDTTFDETPPAATTDLRANVLSQTSIELHWTAPGGDGTAGQADLYDLRQATFEITVENFATADPVNVGPPSTAGVIETVTQTELVTGQEYFYALITEDAVGNRSPLSNVISISTDDDTAPAGVTDLDAEAITASTARLTWTAPGDDGDVGQAASYDLRYNTEEITDLNFGSSTSIPTGAPEPSGSPESVDRDGFASGAFYFALRTTDDNGNVSVLSNVPRIEFVDTTAPNAITDLEITDSGITNIALAWTAPGDDGILGQAAIYDLRRSFSPITTENFEDGIVVPNVPVPEPSRTTESFSVGGLDANTLHYFALRSEDEFGNRSAISNLVSGETDPQIPLPPSGLLAIASGPTSVTLTWVDQSDDEEGFNVEVLVEGDKEYSILTTVPGSDGSTGTYLHTGLTDRTDYSYRVQSSNVSGVSAFSKTATTRTRVPTPVDLVATADTVRVDLSWSFAFVDPDSFQVDRREDTLWETIVTVPGTDRIFADTTVEALTFYDYRVLARDGEDSEFSKTTSVTTPDADPICTIVPTSLDFGEIELGTTKVDSVTFTNTGGDRLTATAVFSQCAHFALLSGGGPFSLEGGESHTVIIEYDPLTAGTHGCDLLTGSNCDVVLVTGSTLDPIDDFWSDEFDAHPSGAGMNAEVRSMIVGGGTKLIVGGAFDDAGGVVAHGIASWSGTSWVREETDSDFLAGGPVSTVSLLEEGADTYIIAGGDFSGGPGGSTRYAERFQGEWMSPTAVPDSTVLATLPVGFSVWAGGLFTDIPGITPPQRFLSRFTDETWIPVGDFDGPVYALADHNGAVVAAGSFDLVDGGPKNNIAIDLVEVWGSLGLGFNGPVHALASIDGFLYAGGDFTLAGTGPALGIAKWNGSNWQGLDQGIDFGVVYAIEKFGNDIVIGGDFETVNGAGDPLRRIAAFDGKAWLPLGPGLADGAVFSLREFQSSLYAGGSFTSAGSKPSYYIARWDPGLPRR